jgi:uncharacterized protein YecE (DUF72 family)
MKKEHRDKIYSGTSGLVLAEHNKRSFPSAFQDKSRLTYYASLFNSIEINSSFKKVPQARTVEKWAANVPSDFRFTFKCWNRITHNKELQFNPEDIDDFLEVITHIGNKKGCLLVQFPGKLTLAYRGQLEKLVSVIRQRNRRDEWKVAFEFRNSSWYQDDVFDLLHVNNMSLVLHDLPPSAPVINDVKAPFVYIRFHGTEKGYRGSYPDDFLFEYAERINAWKEHGKEVYVYFNNTLGDAAKNLITLNRFVENFNEA